MLQATGALTGDLYREGDSEALTVLDELTMWRLTSTRLWRSSSPSSLLDCKLERTSATQTVDCTWISVHVLHPYSAFPCTRLPTFTEDLRENSAHAHAVCTWPSFPLPLEGLGTKLGISVLSWEIP